MDPRPSPKQVAKRAFALAIYFYRVNYERQWPEGSARERESWKEDSADMSGFLREAGLENALSNNEATLFGRDLGQWHPQDVREGSWRGENLLVLLWALGRVETMPPLWQTSDGLHTFAENETPSFIEGAVLRSETEIERMDSYVECIRLRERTPDDFEGISWLAAKAESFGGPPPIEGDLPIAGRPFRTSDRQTRDTVRSLALERHKALQWLLGNVDDLDAPAPEV